VAAAAELANLTVQQLMAERPHLGRIAPGMAVKVLLAMPTGLVAVALLAAT
jgi:hypothetical protein